MNFNTSCSITTSILPTSFFTHLEKNQCCLLLHLTLSLIQASTFSIWVLNSRISWASSRPREWPSASSTSRVQRSTRWSSSSFICAEDLCRLLISIAPNGHREGSINTAYHYHNTDSYSNFGNLNIFFSFLGCSSCTSKSRNDQNHTLSFLSPLSVISLMLHSWAWSSAKNAWCFWSFLTLSSKLVTSPLSLSASRWFAFSSIHMFASRTSLMNWAYRCASSNCCLRALGNSGPLFLIS